MAMSFFPSPADVERYRHFRALSRVVCGGVVKAIPRRAYDEIGEAIGILRDGVLVFDTEDMISVMTDCCVFDWFENGKNLMQQYAETHPAKRGTDGAYLLDVYSRARYAIVIIDSAVPDAGVYCYDVLNQEDLFIMDRSISQSLSKGAVIATRIIPLG